jgi:glycosyltransferase involved in cell wall biosynthesis
LGGGGGAIALNRLHHSLRRAGVDSKIMCQRKTTASPHVTLVPRHSRIESKIRFITSRLGLNDIHRVSSFRIKNHKLYSEADILHIHGTHSGFMSYLALPSLTESKPAIFMLHDMWCFTGHCAYSYDCDRWKIGCGNCPYPDAYPPIRRDGTRLEWKLKNWVYGRSDLSIITSSNWLTGMVGQSMLSRFPIYQIPYGVDTEIYQPLDPEQCRSVLGIPRGKKVIMFSSIDLKDTRKGGDLLVKALEGLPNSLKTETVLLILGSKGGAISETAGIETIDLGYVSSDHLKAIAYSAADLYVFPTRADAFGLVSIESQACGTPVISFRVSGVPDHVREGVTGYLAEPENDRDLLKGIVQLLDDGALRNRMRAQCRKTALEEYSLELQTKRHIELYQKLV